MALKKGVYIINGVERIIYFDPASDTLLSVVRRLGLTGAKMGCGVGQCGVCTVLLNGEPIRACVKKMKTITDYSEIETIEGLGTANNLHPLQLAFIKYGGVQCGYCSPGFILSSLALLRKNPSPTRKEVRDWFTSHNNLCRCTGYKPIVDAVMAAAEVMRGEKPKSSLEYEYKEGDRLYGGRYPRPLGVAKVMGIADYAEDYSQKMSDNMVHLALKFSDHRHANILSIDTSEAEKMPGVIKVFTWKDVEGNNDRGITLPHKRSYGASFHCRSLAKEKVYRLGDVVAMVAADTREHARAAAAKVKVEYEPLPVYENYLESCLPDAVQIQQDCPNVFNFQPVFKGPRAEDIIERGESGEDPDLTVVSGSFTSPFQPHMPLEPFGAVAFYDEGENLTIVFKSQWLYNAKKELPAIVDEPVEKIRLIMPTSGASFGSAMDADVPGLVAIAEKTLRVPVSLILSYQESMLITCKRAASFGNAKLACHKDGKIAAVQFDIANDHGGVPKGGETDENKVIRLVLWPYNVPSVSGLSRGGVSNNAYSGAFRCHGGPPAFTVGESLMDMMAEKLGMDPFELRYRNVPSEENGDTTLNSWPFVVYSQKQMMDMARPAYEKALAWKQEPAAPGWKRGVGIAFGGYSVGSPNDKSECALELCEGDIFAVYNSWQECGQGSDTGAVGMVHEALRELNVSPDRIRLVMNDTGICPNSGPSSGSRGNFMNGNDVRDAAQQLISAMRKADGTYRTYAEMVAEEIPTKYFGRYGTAGCTRPLDPDTGHGKPHPDQAFLFQQVCIEVEEATGKVNVVKTDSVSDIGVIANRTSIEGQAYSGLFHAIGYGLSEHYTDGDKRCLTPLGCGFKRCNEIPDEMNWQYLETVRGEGPFGSGGASESFQSCGQVAIVNAIHDAVGVRIFDLPATPEKVKKGMEAIAAGQPLENEFLYLGEDFEDIVEQIRAEAEAAGKSCE